MSPLTIPGYEILEKIGEGGMGTVYKARQVSLGRMVAIKVLRPDLAKDPTARAQFKLEANSVANLKHQNILMLHEAGEQEGTYFFVMEYVSAYSVHEWLARKGRLSESDALTIADAVAQALQYAWDKGGLVHCDIKPDNLLIDEDGMVKVADFSGISRTQDSPEARLVGEMTIGTPNYMAPEQVHGIEDIDLRADIYALGAVIYQLITGRMPFGNLSQEEAMERQVSSFLPDPREEAPEVSPNLVHIIERMMVKDRTRRYTTWQAVIDDLAALRAGNALHGNPPLLGSSTLRRSSAFPDMAPASAPSKKRVVFSPQKSETPSPERRTRATSRLRIRVLLLFALALLATTVYLVHRLHREGRDRVQPSRLFAFWSRKPEAPDVRDDPSPPPDKRADPPAEIIPAYDPVLGRAPQPYGTVIATLTVVPEPLFRLDDDTDADRPDVTEYTAMLDIHRAAMDSAQRFDFNQARQTLEQWLSSQPAHPFSDEVRNSANRLRQAAELVQSLQRNPGELIGIEMASAVGSGSIVAVRREGLRLRRVLGPGGIADTDVEFRALSPEELMTLFQAWDARHAPHHGAVLLLAQGRLSSALPLISRSENMGLDTEALRAWHTEWQQISRNLAAQRAILEAERHLKANRFREANATLQILFDHYGDTRLVSEFHRDELRAWRNIATEELSW